MSIPAVWGSGITWGNFLWGDTTTTGRPVLYVAIDGDLIGEASAARFRLGRSDWFDVMSPQTATFTLIGEHIPDPNASIVVSCGQGTLWRGYVDGHAIAYETGDAVRTTITATDIIGRLGVTVKAPGRLVSGTLIARWYPIGFYGDLMDVTRQYLDDYAPGLAVDVSLGTSTGSLPTLMDWYFDAPGPMPKKTLLELLNQAEHSSNAVMAMTHAGNIVVVPRAPSGLPTVDMVDVSPGSSVWRRGRDTLINRWLLENPAYDDNTVLSTSDAASVAAYGERVHEVQDFLCATATHYGSAFRTALASPRWLATYRLPVGDLADAWLMLEPFDWVVEGSDVMQVLGIDHDVTPSDWTVTLDLDANQDDLNGATVPTPA